MSAQAADHPDPDEPYEVIHLGGEAAASAATVTAAAHSSAASQISFLPPDPCAPAIIPPNPI
jgi:hypothetical protein